MIVLRLTSNLGDTAAALRRAADGLPDRLAEAVSAISRDLEEALRENAPIGKPQVNWRGDTVREPGVLRASIRFTEDGAAADFFAVDHSGYVIGGTDPHFIQARNKQALSFDWNGGFVVVKSVRHPGTAPNDFRIPAIAQIQGDVDDELEAVGDWVAELFS